MATTPPPKTRIRSPPAPRHGSMNDHWSPYHSRHSLRSSNGRKQRIITTPPPSERKDAGPHSGRGKVGKGLGHTMSPPPSTQSSPKNHATKALDRNGDEHLDQGVSATGKLTSAPAEKDNDSLAAESLDDTNTMLPTPAKTPVKRAAKTSASVQSTARILFRPANIDDVMPANKRNKTSRHVGFTLDSFDGTEAQSNEEIAIFTDSKERIPEVDASEDNPFWDGDDKVAVPAAPKKAAKGKTLSNELVGMVGREDGYVATFRGKSFFTKFKETDDEDEETRNLRRQCTKPRTLFKDEIQQKAREKELAAKAKKSGVDIFDEEEAMTDIEEVVKDSYLSSPRIPSFTATAPTKKTRLSTFADSKVDEPTTPTADSSFTPPTTLSPAQRTRSKHPAVWEEANRVPGTPELIQAPASLESPGSPYLIWDRVKVAADNDEDEAKAPKTRKRPGSMIDKPKGTIKRSKGYESS